MAIGDFALGRFAAGPYAGSVVFHSIIGLGTDTYSVGLTQDGFMIGWAMMSELLNKTDRYGRATIESFHQGCRMSLNCIFHEWKQTELGMVTPNSAITPTGASLWANGIVGSLGTDYSFALNLTARPNTPAALNGLASITFPLMRPRGDFDIGMLFGPEHRVVPFMGDVFPYANVDAPGGVAFAASA